MSSGTSPNQGSPGKPFLGIHLKCCNVYVRAYINATKDAYVANCPRCASPVRIRITSEGGSTSQFFEAN